MRLEKHVRKRLLRPTLRSLINLCAVQGISLGDMLNAPWESSCPRLFDDWIGFRYWPLPSVMKAKHIYAATRVVQEFMEMGPLYIPPASLLIRSLGVPAAAVLDANPVSAELYQKKYFKQGNRHELKVLGIGYRTALTYLHRPNIEDQFVIDMICDATRLNRSFSMRVVDGARKAMSVLSAERLSCYFAGLGDRDAVEWVVDKWSQLAYIPKSAFTFEEET
ncbi:hypothetical protein [Dyella sp. RRB7]|uniref:hypothetical protein n=1 Tax=Dyella sp. RRB7 TaxID=2919502 RepID=UPI001FA96EB6|nr:hypothetical protein [Dyella sp. RRB7]